MSLSPGRRLFNSILARASPKEDHHARSGLESKISGSKGYGLIPTIYAEDRAAGYKGIPAGVMAEPPFIVKHMHSDEPPRAIIHGLVFPVGEKTFDKYGQNAIDFGNAWEECAFRFFAQAFGGIAVTTGRIDCLDPEYPYACATPDGIWWDERTDKVWVLEIKMAHSRKIIAPPCLVTDRRINVVNPHEGFVQYSNDPECPRTPYPWIYVKENVTKYPGGYVPQFLLEMKSTGVLGTKVIQLELGYDFHDPILHVTDYMFDERILRPLHMYWSRVWEIVLRGRAVYQKIHEMQQRAEKSGSIADIAKTSEIMADFQRDFPWPPPAKGQPDKRAIEIMPYIWDQFGEVTREQDEAIEKLSARK